MQWYAWLENQSFWAWRWLKTATNIQYTLQSLIASDRYSNRIKRTAYAHSTVGSWEHSADEKEVRETTVKEKCTMYKSSEIILAEHIFIVKFFNIEDLLEYRYLYSKDAL